MGCSGMAIIGGYAAFFHNSKAITFIVVLGMAVSALCAIRVVPNYGWLSPQPAGGWWSN